ncbi:MAG: hypothetical protein ABI972_21125 [Acidobacteriota bacterium]
MIPVALLLLLAARWPEASSLPNVDEFHNQVLRRFSDGRGFGMSRIIMWPTLGQHFRAPMGAKVDFKPENPREAEIIGRWSEDGWQTGLYVFGASVSAEPASALLHRALKGPGVLNEETPRAELPKWADVYPIAAEAMKRFEAGATSHTAQLNGWTLHARPVTATKESCAQCHKSETGISVGDTLGGVVYMYRR